MSPTLTLSADMIGQLMNPLVYVAKAASGDVLYIGCAKKGISRPFDHDHHVLSRLRVPYLLEVFVTAGPLDAERLETQLIAELKPILNCHVSRSASLEWLAGKQQKPKTIAKHIRRTQSGWQVFLKRNGRIYSKHFPRDTSQETLQQCVAAMKAEYNLTFEDRRQRALERHWQRAKQRREMFERINS